MSQQKRNPDLLSRRSFLGALGTFAAAAPFSLWPMQAHALYNMGAFWKKRRGNGQTSNGYTIGQSLRFRKTSSTSLSRNVTAGNAKLWTLSAWVKLSLQEGIIFAAGTDINNFGQIYYDGTNFRYYSVSGGTNIGQVYFTPTYRDPSAWYHFTWILDATNSTVRMFSNGGEITAKTVNTAIANVNHVISSTYTHYIGSNIPGYSNYFDGYLSEMHFIDGQALDASSFGQTDTITGQWIPKPYNGSYGTNGFYLKFADASNTTAATLGKDSSPNGNQWTPTNLNTYDQVLDSPTNNFCTLNPVASQYYGPNNNYPTYSAGNLTAGTPAGKNAFVSSTLTPGQGKWYAEVFPGTTDGSLNFWVGAMASDAAGTCAAYACNGQKFNGSWSNAWAAFTSANIIGIAMDVDAGTLAFYRDNVLQGTISTAGSLSSYTLGMSIFAGTSGSWNFGQGGQAGLTYDSASGGRFKYTPPAGFKALCTANLPTPTIKTPSQYFNAVLYTGAASNVSVSTTFSPDLLWVKERSAIGANQGHHLFDTVRGAGKVLYSNVTNAEFDSGTNWISFDTNGFAAKPNSSGGQINAGSAANYVAWHWKAGGASVFNTQGTLTSSVSANQTAGFSIVRYTGNGTSGATVGHGLNVAPVFILCKNTTSTQPWTVLSMDAGGADRYLDLSTTSGYTLDGTVWNTMNPSSTVVTLGSSLRVNGNGGVYVMYCFKSIPGYSLFASYAGNGSADGPFVYCGFKPRWILSKRTDATGSSWIINDVSRSVSNLVNLNLEANTPSSEYSTGANDMDILSNGFKLRGTTYNASGATYIFAAFAESPFKYATAR